MVFIHVIRGRPSGLLQFPAREAVEICFASVSSGIRAMCPKKKKGAGQKLAYVGGSIFIA